MVERERAESGRRRVRSYGASRLLCETMGMREHDEVELEIQLSILCIHGQGEKPDIKLQEVMKWERRWERKRRKLGYRSIVHLGLQAREIRIMHRMFPETQYSTIVNRKRDHGRRCLQL